MQEIFPFKISDIFNKTLTLGNILAWLGVLLALLILGAHYFRAGNYLMTFALAIIIALHFGKAAWKHCVVGAFLVWGTAEWAISIFLLADWRISMGLPWARAAAILGIVAALTGLAGTGAIAKGIRLSQTGKPDIVLAQILSFLLVFCSLYVICLNSPGILVMERFFPVLGGIEIAMLAWYAAILAEGLLSARSRKMRRAAWLFFAVIFFGQILLGLAGVAQMRVLHNAHIPVPGMIIFGPLYRAEAGFMVFLVMGAALLAGSAWCSMLCYFGPLESAISSKKALRKNSRFLDWALRYGRVTVLSGGVIVAISLRRMEFSATIAVLAGICFAIASLLLMLCAARKYSGMTYCSAFCPLGLIINVLGRISPWRVRINREICDGCGACEKVCEYRAIDFIQRQKGVPSLRCVLCRDCISACPKSAISLTFPFLKPRIAELLFVVLVVALHAIFIATARPL